MTTPRTMLTVVCWLLACVAWLGVYQRVTLGGMATADMHASRDGYTMLTGRPADPMHPEAADVVYLIDHHRNVMLVYGLSTKSNDTGIVLLDGGRIEVLFGRGRSLESSESGFGGP